MLSIDLFDSKYEKQLHEGAVDQLEQHRIDVLNDRMQELLARAKESSYKNDHAALAGLKRQYDKIKSERDSYYKIREAQKGQDIVDRKAKMKALIPAKPGVAGAVKDVAQGLKNFLQGKPETGPTYEAQKKNSEKVNEYLSMGSDKNYQEAEPYKNYKIYVRRKPFGNTGMYTAHTEIDRKEFMGKGASQEEAVAALRDRINFVLNAQKKVTGSSTIDFNVKFATDLLADPRQTFYAKLENINGEPKLVIASPDIASDPELLVAGDFKRSALRNQVDDSGRATPLPGIPLTAKGLRSGDWIANGRYTVGKETQDRDGNRVFDLTYHSTAHTKSDKLRLNQPAFTLGTAREVDEEKKKPLNQRLDRLKIQARREFPQVDSDQESLLLKLLDKEAQDDRANRQTDARQDAELKRNFSLDLEQEDEIEDLQAHLPMREHGGGIGPRQRWQDLMPEQTNPQNDDWYDDEDQETDLRSGDYVRDTLDGESGEIFRMQGDPYERRVRILDRDGRGWYIEPSRLTRVDPQDPDVQRYFGKQRVRDMDEAIVASGPSQPLNDRAVRKLVWDTMKINADSGEQAIQRALSVLAKKPQSRMVQDLQDKFQNLADRLAQGVSETVTDPRAGMAKIYSKLAPKIERYKDSFLAGQLYDELENYAELHGAEREFKQMMATARGRAHMEYDTNPGGFHNWFWFLPFEDENVSEVKADPTGSWVVYNGDKVKRFKTYSGAKAYAEKAGGKVASSEYYADRIQKSDMAEGWSDRAVAQRTGSPRIPYSVYIKGRKWKDFENEDLAQAVMNKLKAKFRADGRNPETITIAPTDMTEEALIEGIRDTAGATAVIACLLTGGSLTGCATAPQQTTAQQVLKTGQDLGRTVQSAKRITGASAQAEVQQEIRNILRGINRPEELNNSNILRIWKRIKGQTPVSPESQAPEYGPADPVKRPATEGKEILNKEDYFATVDKLDRELKNERNPAVAQILRKEREMLELRAQAQGWIPKKELREDTAALAAEDAILKRIFVRHRNLMMEYGPDKITQAAESVAYNVGDIAHITDEQINEWVGQVEYILGARP
jgi:hypothetical protein